MGWGGTLAMRTTSRSLATLGMTHFTAWRLGQKWGKAIWELRLRRHFGGFFGVAFWLDIVEDGAHDEDVEKN
jgi:hypothetical protein